LVSQSFQLAPAPGKGKEPQIRVEAPNEIIGKRATYQGILVQWKKADKPWQLLNPFAPARYGQGDANLTLDAMTGKPKGFTLFSVRF
jgi:hypothetical protein